MLSEKYFFLAKSYLCTTKNVAKPQTVWQRKCPKMVPGGTFDGRRVPAGGIFPYLNKKIIKIDFTLLITVFLDFLGIFQYVFFLIGSF